MTTQRVIGYVRVSTQEQVEGFGLAVQRDGIRAYCKERGLRLVDIAADEGISGSNGLDTRPGLTEALLRVEDHEVSGIVVYRLDRLARDLLLQETVRGHEKVPTSGQLMGPPVATKSPHWWPGEVPAPH